MNIKDYLITYLRERPLFLSLIRAKELELFSRYLPLKKSILDVGCGDGFFAHTLFGDTLAIDVGLDVEESRQPEASRWDTYKKLVTYDGHAFPSGSRTFATVISNCVLEHIPNLSEVVGEIYRVLKPGGYAMVSVMAKPWEEHLAGNLLLGNSYAAWMRKKQIHVNLLTDDGWTDVFRKRGFRVEKKIGYLSPAACRFIDFAHYLSLPSLLSYVLFRKWVLWMGFARLYPTKWLTALIAPDVPTKEAGAIFFVLRKK